MTIQVLPRVVIDQIAAGEVVERPAHMIKELVENSLDAGATRVEVDFSQGGRTVQVVDNGKGIPSSELHLAFARHATSKITVADDLWSLSSFGFRGEALASISAVSKVTLTSKFSGSEAFRIDGEFGTFTEPVEVSALPGTKLLIESLFENIPARLKFIKSDGAESVQIKAVLKALGLAHPKSEFRVHNSGKLLFHWSAKTHLDRVMDILDVPEVYESCYESDGRRIKYFFAPPHHIAKTSKQIWMFVENRWVQDRTIQAAVNDAYQNLLMHGEYPILAVFLEWPEGEVDFNIHPTKSQVKFRDNSDVFRRVRRGLREALEQAPWIRARSKSGLQLNTSAQDEPALEAEFNSNTKTFDLTENQANSAPSAFRQFSFDRQVSQSDQVELENFSNAKVSSDRGAASVLFKQKADWHSLYQPLGIEKDGTIENISHTSLGDSQSYWSSLQVLGQADLTYIISQRGDALVFVDQHAAHERVMFESLIQRWKTKGLDVQKFLIPLRISMEAHLIEALYTQIDDLKLFGFEIDRCGPDEIEILCHPFGVKEKAVVKAFSKLASEVFEQGGGLSVEKMMMDMAASLACHSAVRAGQALSIEQMRGLLVQMDQFPLSSFCPHGRPVSVDYEFKKLEKDFGRIV